MNTANNNKAVIIVKLVEKGGLKVYKGGAARPVHHP